MTFTTWLKDENHRIATEYRIALDREITHTKRIFNIITPDVREMLLKGLKEIKPPTLPKYTGSDGNMADYNKVPEVNFEKILEEIIKTI